MIETRSKYHAASPAVNRWLRNQEITAHWFPTWRTPDRQRLLINVFLGSLGLGFFTAFAYLFLPQALLLWIPFTLLMCVSWTMLRVTIGSRDTAPLEVLDEYESAVMDQWRRRAYNGTAWSLFFMAFLMICIGVHFGMRDGYTELLGNDPSSWMYFLGLISLLLYLTFSSLPAIGYARNFPASYPDNN